jgi:hypothetical protein
VKTEDMMGSGLRTGTLTVDQVIAEFQADNVAVTPVTIHDDPEGPTWQSVEEQGAGSTLFSDLANAGATAEQMTTVGNEIQRARDERRTIDVIFNW